MMPGRQATGIDGPCHPTIAVFAGDVATAALRARLALMPEVVAKPLLQHRPNTAWPAVRQFACVTLLVATVALALLWLSASHGESHAHDAVARAQSLLPERPTAVATVVEASAPPRAPLWSVDLMLWPAAAIGRDQVGDLTADPAVVAAATVIAHPAQGVERVTSEHRSPNKNTRCGPPKPDAPARRAGAAVGLQC
jgi:hypothetical protein